jgi:hypothetical protein
LRAPLTRDSKRLEPIRARQDRARGQDKYDQEDNPAAAPAAATAAPKPELTFQPIEELVQQKKFEQPLQTTLAIVTHTFSFALERIPV